MQSLHFVGDADYLNCLKGVFRVSASLDKVASSWRLFEYALKDVDDPVWQLSAYMRSKLWQSASKSLQLYPGGQKL